MSDKKISNKVPRPPENIWFEKSSTVSVFQADGSYRVRLKTNHSDRNPIGFIRCNTEGRWEFELSKPMKIDNQHLRDIAETIADITTGKPDDLERIKMQERKEEEEERAKKRKNRR